MTLDLDVQFAIAKYGQDGWLFLLIRGNVVDNFNPEVILWIHEYVIINPKEIMSIGYDSKGIKTGESKFSIVE